MWREYSSGYIRNNRSSGITVIVAAFLSALLLSLLCGVFYNLWKYDVERIEREEGSWQSRITGEFDPEEIRARMEDLRQKRMAKQPLEYGSAGSTFKRPEGYFAGKLIEDAGLRGFRIGDAQVSEKHCGFIINRGHATAAQIVELIGEVRERVLAYSGISLETEVKFLGNF